MLSVPDMCRRRIWWMLSVFDMSMRHVSRMVSITNTQQTNRERCPSLMHLRAGLRECCLSLIHTWAGVRECCPSLMYTRNGLLDTSSMSNIYAGAVEDDVCPWYTADESRECWQPTAYAEPKSRISRMWSVSGVYTRGTFGYIVHVEHIREGCRGRYLSLKYSRRISRMLTACGVCMSRISRTSWAGFRGCCLSLMYTREEVQGCCPFLTHIHIRNINTIEVVRNQVGGNIDMRHSRLA